MTRAGSAQRLFWPLAIATVLAACGPKVGSECERNSACGAGLICDLATEGGYCTQTPCRANECAEEAVCIDFGTETTWCMLACETDADCRGGQACLPAEATFTNAGSPRCLDSKTRCKFCGVAPPSA